ncbi:amino acid/polyamine transporter I [Fimicolochytrium jonesii]|uniref:amino acid/polyamine transporter I n=1 Tax=Fimicolochytrium jonesii TaxID=1396493 RepID=UPI0022FF1965|nr:amino acid/polyamine transporter I [Fimicolochytrium jonesii]KAI8822109.1 amino acid/polyamine transporter I [Fimicolochytrium jonesii]
MSGKLHEAVPVATTATHVHSSKSYASRLPVPLQRIFFVKDIDVMHAQMATVQYKKTLTALDLTLLGVGAIIGAGIFVLTGVAAAKHAGPALIISFIIAGVVCALASLCYAEMGSMIPASGSAYSFTYAGLGEGLAWICGWDLMLEYMVGAATVAVGWSHYLKNFIIQVAGEGSYDDRFFNAPFKWYEVGETKQGVELTSAQFGLKYFRCGGTLEAPEWCNSYVDLPAIAIVILVTALLVVGIRSSARVNAGLVALKVTVVIMFIFAGLKFIKNENYQPFIPENEGEKKYGVSGIFAGAVTVFFAYIGFDAVSTTAQEAKNPQRDLPIGIIGSLTICTALYVAVSAVLSGLLPLSRIAEEDVMNAPVAQALYIAAQGQGVNLKWLTIIITIAAIAGLSSVILVMLMGQPRIFAAMAADGLLPSVFAKIHPKFGTPYITTITTGFITLLFAGLLPVDILGNLTSVGTLMAFFFVSLSCLVLKIRDPHRHRPFAIPGGKIGGIIIPVLSMAAVIVLLSQTSTASIARVFIWMALGVVIYLAYGYRHSKARFDPARTLHHIDG